MLSKGARQPNAANVKAKARKLSSNLGQVVSGKEQIQFKQDLIKLQQDIQANPSFLKKHQALLEAETAGPDEDLTHMFPEAAASGTIAKLGRKFLQDDVLHTMNNSLTPALVKSLLKADPKAGHKLMQRGCLVPTTAAFGPRRKTTWFDAWQSRAREFKFEDWTIVYDLTTMRIDWDMCGHYGLAPPLDPKQTDPDQHVYTHVSLMGQQYPLADDIKITGLWKVMNGWDLFEAVFQHVEKPWRREPIAPMFRELFAERVKPIEFPPDVPLPLTLPPPEPIVVSPMAALVDKVASDRKSSSSAASSASAKTLELGPRSAPTPPSPAKSPATASNSSSHAAVKRQSGNVPLIPGLKRPRTAAPRRSTSKVDMLALAADSSQATPADERTGEPTDGTGAPGDPFN